MRLNVSFCARPVRDRHQPLEFDLNVSFCACPVQDRLRVLECDLNYTWKAPSDSSGARPVRDRH